MEWWFGEGLSYTEFEYTKLGVEPQTISEGDSFTVRERGVGDGGGKGPCDAFAKGRINDKKLLRLTYVRLIQL